MENSSIEAVVIGVSAGGLQALSVLVPALSDDFSVPVIIVQHLSQDSENYLVTHLNERSSLRVMEVEDKLVLQSGHVYVAPAGYHLFIEPDKSFALSTEERINYSRPSIDVCFESAARVYFEGLVGVLLTGANADGTRGLELIKKMGGMAIVQDPATAEADAMPRSAIKHVAVDYVLNLQDIAKLLNTLARKM